MTDIASAGFTLIPATPADAAMLFAIRNDPFIFALGSSGRSVSWDEHAAWYAAAMASPDRLRLWFIRVGQETAGALRFDCQDGPGDEAATISIYLTERFTGRGIGLPAIEAGCAAIFALWPVDAVIALVLSGNARSERVFARAGFRLAAESPEAKTLRLARPPADRQERSP